MGLPEQDDTPSRRSPGAVAWEGRWRGPPWGLHVQGGEGGLTVLPTRQLHSDTRHFVAGLMVCRARVAAVRDREAPPGSPAALQ